MSSFLSGGSKKKAQPAAQNTYDSQSNYNNGQANSTYNTDANYGGYQQSKSQSYDHGYGNGGGQANTQYN